MNVTCEEYKGDVLSMVESYSNSPFTDRENAVLGWMHRNGRCCGEAISSILKGRGIWPLGMGILWSMPFMTPGQVNLWRALDECRQAADWENGGGGPITKERDELFEKMLVFAQACFNEDKPVAERKMAERAVNRCIYDLLGWAVRNDWGNRVEGRKRTERMREENMTGDACAFDPLGELLKPSDAPLSRELAGNVINGSILDNPPDDLGIAP